jgi:CRP-like cAMP-binding protein
MGSSNLKTVLKICPLFSKLHDTDLDMLIHFGKIHAFAQGETIYKKGANAQDMFGVIISGRVGVIAQNGHVIRGMGRGEVLGEIGVTSLQQKRSLTVSAITPIELLEWNVNDIKKVVPHLMQKLKNLAWKNISNYMDS